MSRDEMIEHLESGEWPRIGMVIAALRDRPAPPDALVAKLNVRHDEALHTAIGWMSQEENLVTTREALIELLMMLKPVIFAAPAPVAAPAPEPGQCGLCGERDGQHGQWCQMRKPAPETHAKCNGQGIECLGCAACETPAPDAMPEVRVGDVVTIEATDVTVVSAMARTRTIAATGRATTAGTTVPPIATV